MFTNETGIFNGSVELSYRRYKTYNYLNCHKKLQQPEQYPDFPAKIALYRGAMCPLINSNLKPDTECSPVRKTKMSPAISFKWISMVTFTI